MNEQQLLDTLRGLDRQLMPEGEFAESLYAALERRVRPRRAPSRHLLLVAALLAAAAVGTAIAVGSQLVRQQPVVVLPSVPPSTVPYTVTIPDGTVTLSTPGEVAEAASVMLGRVQSLTFIPEGTRLRVGDGVSDAIPSAVWEVVVLRSDDTATFYLTDDVLRVMTPLPATTPAPAPTLVPLPTRDSGAALELASDSGRTIRATPIPLPDMSPEMLAYDLVALGDVGWATIGSPTDGSIRSLLRLDAASGTSSVVPLPEGVTVYGIVPGRDRLWLRTATGTHALDRVSGDDRGELRTAVDGELLGEDDDGLWFRLVDLDIAAGDRAGAALVNPNTGLVVRQVYTPEVEGAYRGFHTLPAFGSLWDVDRGNASIVRIDPVGGAIQAEIDLTPVMSVGMAGSCLDPEAGVEGVQPIESYLIVSCRVADIVIDPATNAVVEVVPVSSVLLSNALMTGIRGELWVAAAPWDSMPGVETASIMHIDPVTRKPIETLAFSRERLNASQPVVIGDDVWFLVGERAYDGDPYRQNQVLIRIPIAELNPG